MNKIITREHFLRAAPFAQIASLVVCLSLSTAFGADLQPGPESESVRELSLRCVSNNVVLSWPSHPRESFLVIVRSNSAPETQWSVLTNHMRAFPDTNYTAFLDIGGGSFARVGEGNPSLSNLYCVLVVPDFWFSPEGFMLDGGPQKCGADFLPIYTGSSETDEFRRPFVLHVDLFLDSERASEDEAIDLRAAVDDGVERVNVGTQKAPSWAYTTGFWLQHDKLTNGLHTLQLRSLLRLNTLVGPGEQFLTITNLSVRVWTTNAATISDQNSNVGGNREVSANLKSTRDNNSQSWWCQRLGSSFVKKPLPTEDLQGAVSDNKRSLDRRVMARPLDLVK